LASTYVLSFKSAVKVTRSQAVATGSSDGWAKNQLGERRLGEFYFGRQTIGRQARTVRRQQIGRLGDIFQTVGRNGWKREETQNSDIRQMRARLIRDDKKA